MSAISGVDSLNSSEIGHGEEKEEGIQLNGLGERFLVVHGLGLYSTQVLFSRYNRVYSMYHP